MDSVIMTTPSGSSSRLRTRLRSAANAICARNSKRCANTINNNLHHARNCNNNSSGNNNSATGTRNLIIRNNSIVHHRCTSTAHHKHFNCHVNKNINNIQRSGKISQQHVLPLFIAGKFSREVFSVWCQRVGSTINCVPVEVIEHLLNDMHLYPSKSEVSEMIECARMYGSRGMKQLSSQQFLTFGEFCVFACELRRFINKINNGTINQQQTSIANAVNNTTTNNKTENKKYEVFLGGSCNPTTWRADIAIPSLSSWGISFYNPQVSCWSPELLTEEHRAKQTADMLLFVLDSETRCLAGMVEVAQLGAERRCLIVVVNAYRPNQFICNEQISSQEYLDLWYAQNTLLALIRRDHIPIFTNIKPALQFTARKLRGGKDFNRINGEEQQIYFIDKLKKLREAFNSVDRTKSGTLSITEMCEAYHTITNTILSTSDLKLILRNNISLSSNDSNSVNISDVRITFDQFCIIVAEFSSNNNNNNTIVGFETESGCSSNNDNFMINNNTSKRDWNSDSIQNRHQCVKSNSTSFLNNGNDESKHQHQIENFPSNIKFSQEFRDIYLSGSSTAFIDNWQNNIAVPCIKQCGLTYYKSCLHDFSTSSSFSSDNIETQLENIKNQINVDSDICTEMEFIKHSRVLLFVITSHTRSIANMLLAAHCIGSSNQYQIVFCIQKLPEENCQLSNEKITKCAVKDYNRSRMYLSDMAKRAGFQVFESINEAVQCAIDQAITYQLKR